MTATDGFGAAQRGQIKEVLKLAAGAHDLHATLRVDTMPAPAQATRERIRHALVRRSPP